MFCAIFVSLNIEEKGIGCLLEMVFYFLEVEFFVLMNRIPVL